MVDGRPGLARGLADVAAPVTADCAGPRRIVGPEAWRRYPRADHVHFYGFYIGNYPTLERERILGLCELLNDLAR